MSRHVGPLLLRLALTLAMVVAPGAGPEAGSRDQLIFHVQAEDGTVLASQRAQKPFNPASVVKVGTSLWVLENLGESHRFTTRFGVVGNDEDCSEGPLVVLGGGDPDFHLENAALVAAEMNARGVRELTGGLVVVGSLWVGWQNGTVHRIEDDEQRARVMGKRLRDALDSARWDRSARAAWEGLCARRGWPPETKAPALVVRGEIRLAPEAPPGTRVVVSHRSNPLPELLRRFNVYSNNDIIRLAHELGGSARLEHYLTPLLASPSGTLALQTASGELQNRMTAVQVVRLLELFAQRSRQRWLEPAEMLPVVGCDPGPTARMFPELAAGDLAASVVVKTGTLSTTDGGVAVLAGYFTSRRHGEVRFCVAAEDAGRRLQYWRRVEERWLIELMASTGGVENRRCPDELPFSDTGIIVQSHEDQLASR